MRLSGLQKYILLSVSQTRGTSKRASLKAYYADKSDANKVPSQADQQRSITRSLERLIDKGFMVGYGRRTPQKWFIEEVRLTARGRAAAKKVRGEQQRLPLRLRKRK